MVGFYAIAFCLACAAAVAFAVLWHHAKGIEADKQIAPTSRFWK